MKTMLNFSMCTMAKYSMAFLVLLGSAGCSDDDSATPLQLSYVSFYHASPDLDEVDIFTDNSGKVNNQPLDYQDFLRYKSFVSGNRTIKITEEGDNDAILDTTFTFSSSKYYSVFIADSLESLEAVVFGDSTEAPSNGHAMIRFIHMSPDAQPVEVLLNDEVFFSEKAFKSGTAFKEVDEGSWAFQLRDANGEVIYTSSTFEIEEEGIYTLILTGYVNPPAGNENDLDLEIIEN